ncbi:MAG TPA: Uma2 family endonuclease [Anaerolineae bacterium]|nr:Uma2 family endonuclease [Anaerolineae bacterium]HNU03141.1 Uma2 family endonuclease [Anaerolineae bacterium]
MEAPVLIRPPALKRPQRLTDIQYPESDGKPVGETDFHIAALFHLWQALRQYYRNDADVYVAANMLFYYEEGNISAFKVPDVFVVKGIAKRDRRVYKLWQEQKAPSVVFEITSRGTRRDDIGEKRTFYERLGVQEYYLFDPLGEYLSPRLRGYVLEGLRFRSVEAASDGSLPSRELNLILRPEEWLLRVVDPATGQPLPTIDEAVKRMTDALDRARIEAQRAESEAQRAAAAEVRSAQLEAEIQRLRRMLDELN